MERKTQRLAGAGANGRIARAAWLATTALTAILFVPGALRAQTALAPATTPQGGVVVGGSATITQGTGSTTIDQGSQLTAINWQSFNVGSAATVQFNQPSSSAIALNRVVTPEPSVIAGKINANGQIVLVNQSGVVFTKGSQVNAESIVVSTSNVATKDFMAGKLVFSGAPNPGAKIINDGALTARQAGLVGLVAPQVANNGVITAQLGQVVLAGASAFTLDLYGDRLVSLDVTQAVRAVDVGGRLVPALVTNSGLILADGGKVTLTAQDADALVTQLINAGGTIRTNTVGANTGTISIQGVGGDIQIAGNLLAQGTQAGSKGGAVEVLTTGTVSVAPGAVINASGDAGGGVVALGTDLQRATAGAVDTTAPRAAAVVVAAGAVVKADATGSGNGGRVTLLSSQATNFAGAISAQGGPQGGNGGMVEISSDGVISLGGTVVDTALNGQPGEILLDPQTLIVSSSGTSSGQTTYIDPASLVSLAGSIVLSANKLVDVASAVNLTGASVLTLSSGGDVTIGASIDTVGSLEIDAAGTLLVGAGLTAGSIALLDPGAKTLIDIGAPVVGTALVALESGGGISETTGGVIATASLVSGAANSGNDMLGGANSVTSLGVFTLGGAGTLTFADTGSLNVAGTVSAADMILESSGAVSEVAGGTLNVGRLGSGGTTIGGAVSLGNGNNIGTLGAFAAAGDILLADSTALDIAGVVQTPGLLTLQDGGAVSEASGGTLNVGTLSSGGTAIGGAVSLGNGNNIGTLGAFAAAGNILLADSTALNIAGVVQTPGQLKLQDGGTVSEITGGTLNVGTLSGVGTFGGDVLLTNGNSIGTLGNMTLSGTHVLAVSDAGSLNVAGTVVAPAATLSAGTLVLAGPVLVTNGLALEAGSGGISEAAGGTLNTGTLSSGGTTIGGAVSLGNGNNIGTLGAFAAAGNILLADSTALNIAGVVQTPGQLKLQDGGTVSEITGGTLNVGTLSGVGIFGGDVLLTNGNSIGTLGNMTLSGTHVLAVSDAGSLNVAGTVVAPGATLSAGTLVLAGPVSVTNGLALEAGSGGISEVAGGALNTGTLSSGGTTIGGAVSLGNSNNIGTLGAFAALGNILLADSGALDIAGVVQTPGLLTLQDGGAVSEITGGTLNVGTLGSGGTTIGGDVLLTNGNSIGTLGNLLAAGNLVLDNAGSLTVAGPVQANAVTLVDNGTVTLGGLLRATGGQVALVADGLLEATGGAVSVGSGGTIDIAPYIAGGVVDVGGTAAGGLELSSLLLSGLDPAGTLVIGSAGSFGAGSIYTEGLLILSNPALVLDAAGPITQTGILIGKVIDMSGSSLALDGGLEANTLNLASGGNITQPSTGELYVGTLSSGGTTIGGDVALNGSLNLVFTLGGFADAGNFNLVDAAALVVDGPVTARNIALSDGSTSASSLAINGTLAVGSGGTISLAANSITSSGASLVAPGGTVAIAPYTSGTAIDLGGTAAGLDLSGALLGAVSGSTSLVDISTTGSIAADGAVSVAAGALLLSGNGVTFNGTLAVPGALELASTNGVTTSSGESLSVGTLLAGGAISGPVNMALGNNVIGTLGAFSLSGGDLALSSQTPLLVNGALSAGNITLNAAGLTLASVVNAASAVTLNSGAGVVETGGGAIDAPSLTTGGATITGAALLGGANTIGTLGGFMASGDVLVNDARALSVAGSVAGADITLDAAGLTFAGDVTTPGLLALASSSGVTQSAGTISAATLSSNGGTIAGGVDMALAGNALRTIAGFAASGDVRLVDTGPLSVTGPFSAANIALSAAGIAVDGGISTGLLQLASSAGVSEGAGGQVRAATLSSGGTTIAGDAVLNTAGNLVNTLGAFAATGGLTLNNATDLTLAGPVSLGGTLALLDTGNITQTGGAITAAALTSDGGTIGGNALFGGAGNAIPVLGAFAAGGNVLLNDTGAMTLEGNINAGNMLSLDAGGAITQGSGIVSAALLNAAAASLTLPDANLIGALGSVTASGDISAAGVGGIAGPVSANNATLSTTGNFTETGNAQIANALYVTAGGSVIQSAGSVSAQTATLSAGGSMSLSGTTAIANEVDLIAANSITHAAGALSAATLVGSAGTLASFGAYTNIGTLGSFIMHDSLFALANAGALTIVGPVVANTVTITAQGPITLAGSATGGLFITGTIASSTATAPSPLDSVISSNGSAASILQTGTFLVNSGPNALTYLNNASQPATLFLYTQPSGTMNFAANTGGSLYAPSLDLVLAAGAAGVVTGNVNLQHLEVLSALSVNLNGTIAGIPGPTAAGGGTAFPFPQPGYRFNTCPIGSVNCTILPIEMLPEGNPLENFDISPRKRKRLDHGVQLPGIATRDF
ncbi:hypothetical protein GCM10010909_03210 [Acidocella aquatica]|uniref:Filamentous haemagglutinin FhaB/tRNA nuclease CdiA-like TPS domain-containing protein n=1 Tax=Acidocella aquatica TaxID=1922313 RepID=A0ABQ6A614_9PROT|nr:filamentous hemagglutinin N-terminal domain-containing protein [Acidocella aquatica]GLR65643.1 hypothetical protein GCM10010909_03210 [Acidocella aquatica]